MTLCKFEEVGVRNLRGQQAAWLILLTHSGNERNKRSNEQMNEKLNAGTISRTNEETCIGSRQLGLAWPVVLTHSDNQRNKRLNEQRNEELNGGTISRTNEETCKGSMQLGLLYWSTLAMKGKHDQMKRRMKNRTNERTLSKTNEETCVIVSRRHLSLLYCTPWQWNENERSNGQRNT